MTELPQQSDNSLCHSQEYNSYLTQIYQVIIRYVTHYDIYIFIILYVFHIVINWYSLFGFFRRVSRRLFY